MQKTYCFFLILYTTAGTTNATAISSEADSTLLYLGPGAKAFGGAVGLSEVSEVFKLPTNDSGLETASCQIPQDTNKARTKSVVGFVLDGHLTLCGGYAFNIEWGYSTSCSAFKNSRWTAVPPLLVKREDAAATKLLNGSVLVSGGRNRYDIVTQSTELLSGSDRTPSLQLPSGRFRHCLLALSTGGLFLHGGTHIDGYWINHDDTYISTDLLTWTQMKGSEKARGGHACAEVTIKNSQQVLISGGISQDVSSEIYSVSSNTWTVGPDLPDFSSVSGKIVSHLDQVYYAGGYFNIDIYQLKDDWTQKDAWIKIGTATHPRTHFPALLISQDVCHGNRNLQTEDSKKEKDVFP